jgi:hypothetical protein
MSTLRIDIEKDTARPALRALRQGLANRVQLNRAAAEGMLPAVQLNLRHMADTNHNPFGVRSTFWNLMLSGTSAGTDDQGGYVAVPSPVGLRALGGTVVPKQSKYLAIPARAEAYGKSPKDFNDLTFILMPTGRFGQSAALVQTPLPDGTKTRGKKKIDAQGRRSIAAREQGGMVFYWLVPRATIPANPDVLPTKEQLASAATQGVSSYIGAIVKRGGGNVS